MENQESVVKIPREAHMIIQSLACIRSKMVGLTTKRSWDDQFTDRVKVALTEPTFSKMMDRLASLLQTSIKTASNDVIGFLAESCLNHELNTNRIMWIRENVGVVTVLACLCAKEHMEYLKMIDIIDEPLPVPEISSVKDHVFNRKFDIDIDVLLQSPLSHGADTKWGNNTLFRRMRFFREDGSPVDAPFYSGNAIRGQIRDLLSDHFLTVLGFDLSVREKILSEWFYHLLYCGGALTEARGNTKQIVGYIQRTNLDGVRQLRRLLPMVSLLGGAIGDRILPGRLQVYDLRPECIEWGNGDVFASDLLDWTFLTRREDAESHEEHSGMICNTEVLKPGCMLHGGITTSPMLNDIEQSCLACGLNLFQEAGLLGGQNARGYGQCTIVLTPEQDGELYIKHLQNSKEEILDYLISVDAITPLESAKVES